MTAEKGRVTSRRQALRLGGAAGGLAAAAPLLGAVSSSAAEAATSSLAGLPVKLIEQIIEVQGMVTERVLQIEIDRDDIPDVHKEGVPIKPAFEINGTVCFQALSGGSVVLNGDMAFKAEELNPAMDHMFKVGDAYQLAREVRRGLGQTNVVIHCPRQAWLLPASCRVRREPGKQCGEGIRETDHSPCRSPQARPAEPGQ
jgi:uncharacterized protein DUF1259